MNTSTFSIPTLSQFHKILCDVLNVWHDDTQKMCFHIPPTEIEHRKVIEDALDHLSNLHGHVTLEALVEETTKRVPKMRSRTKQHRSIRAAVVSYAKQGFCHVDELRSLTESVSQLIAKRYPNKVEASLAESFYHQAMGYYAEWIREFTFVEESIPKAYEYFINQVFKSLLVNLVAQVGYPHLSNLQEILHNDWPMRACLDDALARQGISPYKLRQYHTLQKSGASPMAWSDVECCDADNAIKQSIKGLSDHQRIKWRGFEQILSPILSQEGGVQSDHTRRLAFACFISHNVNLHLSDNQCEVSWDPLFVYPRLDDISNTPASVLLDGRLDGNGTVEVFAQAVQDLELYHERMAHYEFAYNQSGTIPNSDTMTMGAGAEYSIQAWVNTLSTPPKWALKWLDAQRLRVDGQNVEAAKQYNAALDGAMYKSGPLLMKLFYEIASLCKCQAKLITEKEFERDFDSVGGAVTQQTKLLGFVPDSGRDRQTSLPNRLSLKEQIIIGKVDDYTQHGGVFESIGTAGSSY
ncbi:hypothetical protein [uncultured Vibrio sp.]|mgnify:CR=1 FL=1|uniref:hypothetical protein n=1 Tax=uncultured Vibrio sp. TaxID=114054 RepID=UPI0025D42340|nr:hypothetical protein [uncultured Vibrio sp.]